MPAGALPTGEYRLEVIVELEGSVQFETSIDFYIDPSDSVTCAE